MCIWVYTLKRRSFFVVLTFEVRASSGVFWLPLRGNMPPRGAERLNPNPSCLFCFANWNFALLQLRSWAATFQVFRTKLVLCSFSFFLWDFCVWCPKQGSFFVVVVVEHDITLALKSNHGCRVRVHLCIIIALTLYENVLNLQRWVYVTASLFSFASPCENTSPPLSFCFTVTLLLL